MLNRTMNTELNSDADWRPCAAGEIGGFVQRMRWRQRRPLLIGATAASAVILIAAGVLLLTAGRDTQDEYRFGGIACSEVRAHSRAYIAGRIDAGLRRRIDLHLAECPHCGPLFRQMMDEATAREAQESASATRRRGPLSAGCDCAECQFAFAHSQHATRAPDISSDLALVALR